MNFYKKVLLVIKKIPKGKVTTYVIVAKNCGNKNAARAVGNALNKNTDLINTPCHRIIKSTGEIGGYVNGTKNKIKILKKEGIEIKNNKIDLKKYLFKF